MASVTKRKWDEEWDKVLSVPDHEADKYAPVTGRPQRTRKVPERFGGSEDAAPLRHRRQSSSAKSSSQKPKSANDRSVSTPKTGETKLSLDHPGSTPKQSLSLLTEPTSTPGNSGPATEHDTLFTEEKILSPEKPETEQEQFFSFPTEPTSHHYSALTAGDPVSQRTGPTLPLQRTGPLEEQSLTHTSQPSSLLPASRKHAYSPERTPSPPLSSLSSDRQLVKTIAHSNSLQAASAGSNKRQRTERHRLEPADQLSYSHQLESEVTTTAALTDAAAMAQPSTNDIPPGEVPGVFVAAAAPHAKLTFEEANMRSHPSPGDELVLAVTAAQNAGMIRKSYDSVSVRNVDGRFMVPVKCQFCIDTNSNCNRAWRCHTCVENGLSCFEPPEGRMMTNARTEAVFAFEDQRLPQAQKKKKERMVRNSVELGNRPPTCGEPPLWAAGRQALCETLPYYRSYQSGPYCHGGLCYGSLLDGEGGERDYMDGDIVITRVGGGMSRSSGGQFRQTSDQDQTHSVVRSMLANQQKQVPVVLILGKKCSTSPTHPRHEYSVMDWFQVSHVWSEKSDDKTFFKVRFQKLYLNQRSWWLPLESPEPSAAIVYGGKAIQAGCIICQEQHSQIYSEGWMCLNKNCAAYWTMGGQDPPSKLHYCEAFLTERTRWNAAIKPPYDLIPPLVPIGPGNDPEYSVSRLCWKGVVCPRCHRCNSRTDWHEWTCENEQCDFRYSVPHTVVSARSTMDPHSPVITGHAIPQNEFQKPITETIRLTANYRIHTYHLPECGTVTHFLANSVINSAPGGPDEMFLAMQREKIGLKRFPLKLSLLTGHNLTQHFAVNYGMPYKYVVEVASKPFSEAPNVLVQALHRIIWAGEKSVNDGSFDDAKFNEMLTVGYFEGQKMDYHDDGEADLGPTIATLSLGCPASMTLRMKYAPHFGVSKQGNPYNDPPLPGCADYENRRRHHSLSAGRPSSPDNRRGGLLPTDPNLHTPRKGNPPVLLSLQLNHGDMVCMHGAGIQKYYEHAVTPAGKLRFSLTCRHIRPSAVPTDEHSKGVLPHSNAYGYCGEELVVSQ